MERYDLYEDTSDGLHGVVYNKRGFIPLTFGGWVYNKQLTKSNWSDLIRIKKPIKIKLVLVEEYVINEP